MSEALRGGMAAELAQFKGGRGEPHVQKGPGAEKGDARRPTTKPKRK